MSLPRAEHGFSYPREQFQQIVEDCLRLARDVYTRRQEGSSVWVVRSDQIVASDPGDKDMLFDPAEDKVYRHPTFYKLPDSVDHM